MNGNKEATSISDFPSLFWVKSDKSEVAAAEKNADVKKKKKHTHSNNIAYTLHSTHHVYVNALTRLYRCYDRVWMQEVCNLFYILLAAACIYPSRRVLLCIAGWKNLMITLNTGRRIRALLQGEIWLSPWMHISPATWPFAVSSEILCFSLNCYSGQTESGAWGRSAVNVWMVISFPAVLNTISSNRYLWELMQTSKAQRSAWWQESLTLTAHWHELFVDCNESVSSKLLHKLS